MKLFETKTLLRLFALGAIAFTPFFTVGCQQQADTGAEDAVEDAADTAEEAADEMEEQADEM
jgi:hypothetical protein